MVYYFYQPETSSRSRFSLLIFFPIVESIFTLRRLPSKMEITEWQKLGPRSRSVHFLGTCEKTLRNAKFRFFFRAKHFPFASRHCTAVLVSQVPKKCTELDLGLLYILTSGLYSKFARKNNFLALGVCFPQPCSSAGRRFAASRSRLQYYRQIVLFPQQKCR